MLKHSRDVSFLAGVVYFCQGSLGISGVALPLFLRSLKWSVAEITAVSSIAAFPWVLKILYGLLSDCCPLAGYRRKSYLILFSLLSAAGWCGLIFFPSEKNWILIALLMTNLGFAATDVITDGLIVEHSTDFSSHIYQSIAWGARSAGAMVSGILGGWLASRFHPQIIFALTALLPISVTACALWILEKKIPRGPFTSAFIPVKRCFTLLLKPNLQFFCAILFLISVSASFGIPFFFHLKEKLGFEETFLGLLSSLGWAGAMAGSLIYARWLRRIPLKITLRWAILFNCLNIFSTLLIADKWSAAMLVILGGVMGCLVMLPVMSAAASLTHHTGVEGTLFAVLMSVFNLGQIGFGFLGGQMASRIGLYPLITLAGMVALSGLFFTARIDIHDAGTASA